jgi:hypothetical protein
MELTWRDAESVELVELVEAGFLVDAGGERTTLVTGVRIAVEGGYLHVAVAGLDEVQVVSAPMVRRVVYRRS